MEFLVLAPESFFHLFTLKFSHSKKVCFIIIIIIIVIIKGGLLKLKAGLMLANEIETCFIETVTPPYGFDPVDCCICHKCF